MRKDIDLAHPTTEWVLTPQGAVPKWHRMSPKVFICTTEHQDTSQNIPLGAWQQHVWHTIDFRNGPHWEIDGYPTEHQPNIDPYDLDKIVEVRWDGIVLMNNTSARTLERVFGVFRAPGSELGDHSGLPQSIQGVIWENADRQAGERFNASGTAPVIDGKTEFYWWLEGVGISGFHLRLTGYTIGIEHFWARMQHFGYYAPSRGGGSGGGGMTGENWTEWARGSSIPASETTTDPSVVDSWNPASTRNSNYYRTASAGALNAIDVHAVTRVGGIPKWHVADETADVAAHVAHDDGQVYQITIGTREDTIESNREVARNDARAWLTRWENSAFLHLGVLYDANRDQEGRIALTDSRGRDDAGFSTWWYDAAGNKETFSDQASWRAFVASAHGHVETGNTAFEQAMTDIATAPDTATLDSILAALPTAPAGMATRSTGPVGSAAPPVKGSKTGSVKP